jgi:hypothetical protein
MKYFISREVDKNNKTKGYIVYKDTDPSKRYGFTLQRMGVFRSKTKASSLLKRLKRR